MELAHDELRSLVAPYVLGALPAEEVPLVRSHIASCDECMAAADGYSRDAASLLLSVEAVPLPDGFADRVITRVSDERPVSAPAPHRARRWSLALVMSMFVVVVAGLGAALLDARSDLAETQGIVRALAARDGIALSGGGGVAGKMVPTDEGSVFVATGLEEPAGGRTYQLWLMDRDRPVSVSTFDASDGVGIVETARSIEGFDGAAVTIEPEGGSPQPTSEPIMSSG